MKIVPIKLVMIARSWPFWTGLGILGTFYLCYYPYRKMFGGPWAEDQGTWGQFGDYIGGVLNPLFTALTFFGLIYTMRLTRRQVTEASAGAIAQNTLSVIKMLQENDARASREHLFKILENKTYTDWIESDREHASKVCSMYDVTAIMVKKEIIDKDIIIENWGPSIQRCYKVLQPHIDDMQKPNKYGPKYWDGLKWLNDESVKAHPGLTYK